ncbi:MAG: Ig-like domain-containing protein [Ignavibacteria bacterium]
MKHLLSLLLLILIFSGCANQLPPGGGTIDKESPSVIKTFPESGTLNYNKNYVEFEFNEYINKRSVLNSIFISPYFKEDIEIKWAGKRMRIIFPEKLKADKTYVVTLGTDITDLRGNKLAETTSLRFSTGDKIDDGVIEGKIFDDKPDGVMIFFYLIDSLNQKVKYDSVKPDFVCQSSKEGGFSILGLPNGIFRIIAVQDQMKNFLFDINEDKIGLPVKDYILSDTLKKISNVFFELIKIDTIKPLVNSVKFEDLNHIKVNFNEPIDLNSISLDNFLITDTLTKRFNLIGFFSLEKNTITLVSETLNPNRNYLIEISGVRDLAGNEVDKTKLDFYSEETRDTTAINLRNLECNFSTNVMEYFNPVCTLYFNDLVRMDDFINASSILDTLGSKFKFQISRTDSSNFILKFPQVNQNDKLLLRINFGLLKDLAGNLVDTIVTKTLETNSESDYGSISGVIKNWNMIHNLNLEVKSVNKKKSYKVNLEGDKYQIKNILPGSYLLKLSMPEIDSHKGRLKFSPTFIYYQDTIKVKSRWPTTDVNFDVLNLIR